MVEFRDRSTLAQLGPSDMRVPIASCLAWPARMNTPLEPLNLTEIGELTFFEPDVSRFPATLMARNAITMGGGAPAVLNAANEVAVAAFLDGQIGFSSITAVAEEMLNRYAPPAPTTLEDVLTVDADVRRHTAELLENYQLV
jgi:1-deoxy-D-xylulose-5-phosphate reductoisomerase